MTKVGDKMWAVNTVRPFGDKSALKSTRYCGTESGKNKYVEEIISKYGQESIISVIEYVVTNVK